MFSAGIRMWRFSRFENWHSNRYHNRICVDCSIDNVSAKDVLCRTIISAKLGLKRRWCIFTTVCCSYLLMNRRNGDKDALPKWTDARWSYGYVENWMWRDYDTQINETLCLVLRRICCLQWAFTTRKEIWLLVVSSGLSLRDMSPTWYFITMTSFYFLTDNLFSLAATLVPVS